MVLPIKTHKQNCFQQSPRPPWFLNRVSAVAIPQSYLSFCNHFTFYSMVLSGMMQRGVSLFVTRLEKHHFQSQVSQWRWCKIWGACSTIMQYMQHFFGEHTPSPRKQCFIEAYEQLDRDLICHTGHYSTYNQVHVCGRSHVLFTLPGPYNHVYSTSWQLHGICSVSFNTCICIHIVCWGAQSLRTQGSTLAVFPYSCYECYMPWHLLQSSHWSSRASFFSSCVFGMYQSVIIDSCMASPAASCCSATARDAN
jgi:hypothetical protein